MTASYLSLAQCQKIAGFDSAAADAMYAALGSSASALEILTGATGSIIADISKPYSVLQFTGTKAFTLPDGDRAGLVHTFIVGTVSATPIGTLTVTTPLAGTQATRIFDTAGQRVTFLWDGSAWRIIAKNRGGALTVVVGTDVLTGRNMNSTYNLSITGTATSTGTKALPDGEVEGEVIWVRCTTAATIPAGNIDGVFTTIAGVAGTHLAVNATTDYEQLRWTGASWQEQITNSVTIS